MSNWAEFNVDLLNLILSKLFGKDRLSFRLVCKPWNALASTSPYRYSPCLMYYYRRTRTWKFYQYNTFLELSFPDLEKAELRCSKYGWFLMSRFDDTLFFFDPSNNRKIDLPSKVGDLYSSLTFYNPPTSPECVVVGIRTLISSSNVGICTLKRGEDKWECDEYPVEDEGSFWMSLGAPVLHCGMIYFLSVSGEVAVFDIERKHLYVHFKCLRLLEDDEDLNIREQYLVKLNGEEGLFGVFVIGHEREVSVFRLSSEMKWDPVEGIGDQVLYLSHISSFGHKAVTKSMENTISFPMFHGDNVPVLYSLSDGKYRSLNEDYLENHAYGIKRLDSAAWIMHMPAPEVIPTISLSWL